MSEQSRSEVRTGLFVLVALLVFAVFSLQIVGTSPLARARVPYEVLMKSAGGVRGGDQVRLAGVEVGRVEEVVLSPGEEWPVRFHILLDAEIPITSGATARFSSDGLLGPGYLEIDSGPVGGERLSAGATIEGAAGGSLTDLLAGMGAVSQKVDTLLNETTQLVRQVSAELPPTVDRVQALLSDDNIAAVSGSLAALDRTLANIDARLPPLIEHLDALAADLQSGVRGIPELTAEMQALAGDLRTALGEDGERLTAVLVTAEDALGSAGGAFDVVEDRAVDLEATLRDLREAAANLKAFSQAVKERPSRLLRTTRSDDRKPGDGVER